jgi:uncharacterized protein
MDFEWGDYKAEANERKHGVSFPEAQTVFADALTLSWPPSVHGCRRRATPKCGASGVL